MFLATKFIASTYFHFTDDLVIYFTFFHKK